MAWTRVSSTRWERPISGMEVYTSLIGKSSAAVYPGREQYVMFSRLKVDLNIADPVSALKQAWTQARCTDPDLATTLEDDKKIYEVPTQAGLQKWLESTFIISDEPNGDAIYESQPKITQATLYYLPKALELVFRAPHYTIDGIGVMMFWDRFLSAITTPKHITFGKEYRNLAPPLEQALECPAMPTLEQTETAHAMLMGYIDSLPSIGPVSRVGKAPAARCRNIEHTFSPETTSAIIAASRRLQVSVTSVVHAAYIRTIIKHADPHSLKSRYTSIAEFDLRRYMHKPSNKVAVANYYTALYFSTDLPSCFRDLVRALDRFYKTSVRDYPEVREMTGEYMRLMGELVQGHEYQNAPIPTDAMVSSLGVVERYVRREYTDGKVVVKDFKLTLDVVLGMSVMHVFTFGERLRLVYAFNDGYEEPVKIRGYLEDVERVLRGGLGFDMQMYFISCT